MSAKSLVLISGKGGSGKTTIGICMATMLADCGQKVLFIDCDLSTNGASYFYEERINSVDHSIISFTDLLGYVTGQKKMGSLETITKLEENKAQFLLVDKGVYFIPSVLPNDLRTDHFDGINVKLYIDDFCRLYNNYIKTQFDIVIFDCQAGYSSVLDLILPVSDSSLLVMEADAISSAAARNLHIKIATSVKKIKMYQIFSKVTEEEKEIYGQVKLGTFYTTIDAVLFDSSVRNAFAFARIPDLMSTKSEFGMKIYNICKVVFPSLNMKEILKKYRLIFDYNIVLGDLEKSKPNKGFMSGRLFIGLTTGILILSLSIYSVYIASNQQTVLELLKAVLTLMGVMYACFISFSFGAGEFGKMKKYRVHQKEREMLLEKYPELVEVDRRLGADDLSFDDILINQKDENEN